MSPAERSPKQLSSAHAPPNLEQAEPTTSARIQAAVAIGQQPRGKRVTNMLSEYACLEWVRARDPPQLDK